MPQEGAAGPRDVRAPLARLLGREAHRGAEVQAVASLRDAGGGGRDRGLAVGVTGQRLNSMRSRLAPSSNGSKVTQVCFDGDLLFPISLVGSSPEPDRVQPSDHVLMLGERRANRGDNVTQLSSDDAR